MENVQPLSRSSVDCRPSIYAINAAAITEPHAVQQLSTTDINSYNVDIAAVTETHPKNKHTDSVVAIPRYTLLRRDRLRRKGGGVALYVRASLSVLLWTFSADNRTYELHTHTHTHTQPFNGLLSGTTRVGRYQKKYSPTHTHPDHRTSFIIFLHLQRSMASSLFSLRA